MDLTKQLCKAFLLLLLVFTMSLESSLSKCISCSSNFIARSEHEDGGMH